MSVVDAAPPTSPDSGALEPDAASPPGSAPRYCERDGYIIMEAEHYSDNVGFDVVDRADASGGQVMQVGSSGALSFDIETSRASRMYLWLRTHALDPESNGVHVELDGTRIEAPAGHAEAGSDNIYLFKYGWSWEPEWQGDGTHVGPVTLEVSAGRHRLTITKRLIERPHIDRVALSWSASPPTGLGPPSTPCAP